VITVFIVHPPLVATLIATVIPHVQWDTGFVTAVVAVLGTTISPYLFFWQASSEVDEMKAAGALTRSARRGVSRKEVRAARFDIMVGMGFSQLVMYCIILTSATVLHAHGQTNIQTAQEAANALQPIAGQFAFILFAAGMIGTGLLAVPILSGSAAYAVKEFMNISGSLAVKFHYRPTFYLIIIVATAVGAALNFDGVNPIAALFITAVINGVVAPPLLLLIVLLASDRKIMGAHVSGKLSQSLTWMATAAMTAAALVLGITLLRQT
jgi:Mn2+/Fe2+ NRAMP family transporter